MKKFQKFVVLFSFFILLVACGKKGVYTYSEKDKYALIIAAYTNEDKEAQNKIEGIKKELRKDSRRAHTKKKAEQELSLWEAQESIVNFMALNDALRDFEKAYKKGKANKFIEEQSKKMKEKKTK